jgi:hypothetical protein
MQWFSSPCLTVVDERQQRMEPEAAFERRRRVFLLRVRRHQRRVEIDDQRRGRIRAVVGCALAGQRPHFLPRGGLGLFDRRECPVDVRGEGVDQPRHGGVGGDPAEHAWFGAEQVHIGQTVTAERQRDREIEHDVARIMHRQRSAPRRERLRRGAVDPACRDRIEASCPGPIHKHGNRRRSRSITGIEGQVLMHCHVGCRTEDVLAAIGLELGDLYDDRRGPTYAYDDGRRVHRSPDKKFRQSGKTNGQPTLYKLSKVIEAIKRGEVICLVEGEKDADALWAIGVAATCAPMGANSFHKVPLSS